MRYLPALFALTCSLAQAEPRLLLHLTFDEPVGLACRDACTRGREAVPQGRADGVRRIAGLFGNALALSGNHLVAIPGQPNLDGLSAVTFSAWTMPTELSAYREIFRKEDGDQRVLFSFQNDGTILSLGLNIGGYVECDAKIEPAAVLDGRWHHCAATFDGQVMRVYLDGRPIGELRRPGRITAGGQAPGCVGSSSGGECFQGALDDLRIYAAALTGEEIRALHQEGVAAMQRATTGGGTAAPVLAVEPLAWWPADETLPARQLAAKVGPACLSEAPSGRRRGVHGPALDLHGQHALATPAGIAKADLAAISFAAWARPTELSGFREIFRQECARRLLFSFQEHGTILSLGLNIGGYLECDGPIDPAKVLDGQWHHCAATFDGQAMRVYLDGKQVQELARAGRVAIDPTTPCYVGSSDGKGEHFQGGLDDLRIYAVALSADQVAALHQAGRASLAQQSQATRERLAAVLEWQPTFAQTLAASRRRLLAGHFGLDLDLADELGRALRSKFPDDFQRFGVYTGRNPLEWLVAPDSRFHAELLQRLSELLLEYQPLTEAQRRRQTPAEARRWTELAQLARQVESLETNADAGTSPDSLRLLFEVGRRIDFRPVVQEAVAPYVRPSTPETRTLDAGEARATLERDWLYQCRHQPSAEAILKEIGWARALAARIGAARAVDHRAPLARLAALEAEAKALKAPSAELYCRVREIKRQIHLSNPVIDFQQVLFVDMPYPQGSEWPHETRHRLGYMAVPGARLLVLDGLSPAGKLRQLMPQAPLHGSFWRPDLSYDAQTVLFCYKPHNEKSFHLYEIGLDGRGLRQVTDGPYDDLDPIYLPDGRHFIFSTTRAHTYVRCMPPTNAYVLARCDRDGRDLYLLSTNNEPDYLPSVMDDGRILYTRWEYTDKPLWRAQSLWTMRPDGTQVNVYWGNQSVWPDLLKDARQVPGSRRVMFTGSAHHNWFAGSVGLIDRGRGMNFPDGLTKVTAETTWPESGNGPVDPVESPRYHASGAYDAYYSPYPLGEHDFLVSASRGGKYLLYLMDTDGNRELVYEGVHNILHALPVRPRTVPPVLADTVAWPTRETRDQPAEGVLYSANVYDGTPPAMHGLAKYLRVLAIDPKTYTYWHQRPYASTGPVVSMVQSDGVKRVLGTVPIEADGSVNFTVPAGRSLHFQLLDERQRALQTMRSFAGVMPGERRGCVGCHEMSSQAPAYGTKPLALRKPPQRITPPSWGEDTVSYDRYVQPVLDQACGKCHQGNGEGRATLDLTRRPGYAMFDEPYVTLTGRPTWGQPYQLPAKPPPGFGIADTILVESYSTVDPAAYRTPEPMTRLSYRSRLIELASNGQHHGVKLAGEPLLRLILWVDTMCPYYGEDEIRKLPDPQFQGVEWLAIRPRIATAPRIARPGPLD